VGGKATHLIKLAVIATLELFVNVVKHGFTRLVPKPGKLAGLVVGLANAEIEISAFRLPNDFVLVGFERCRLVEVTFEPE
jgi:anti-sigma regulatory factor (Ser/Thr protein kinase)